MNIKKNTESPKSEQQTAHSIQKECDVEGIRQTSHYTKGNKPVPDNNMFFEERHNPLSSKGN
ncbi:MAG: hypothetical protein PUB17_04510 [Lachnospiraceae bacterium]|nr:hypothetical protein [Lachnospiraceae bacterium]